MEELIPIFFFMSVAAVLILRPISKRLGSLLEAMARERQPLPQTDNGDLARVRVLVEHIAKRVDLMEERLDFTERLLSGTPRRNSAGTAFEPLIRERETEHLRG
jgi:hypothetical protein